MIRFLGFLLLYSGTVMAQLAPPPLKVERLLDKLSIQLRGRSASASEKADFQAALDRQPDRFQTQYSELIDLWMQDPGYARSIAQLHRVWWRVPTGTVAQHAGEIVAADRPYSEIYQRDYLFVDGASSRKYQRFQVKTLADLPLDAAEPVYVPLAPDEKRFRGFFSSLEFLETYPDTATNKNRKRSSQVFRIGFCETLQNLQAKRSHASLDLVDEHGQNPDCIGCHRRLDPMARFFDQWEPPVVIGDLPAFNPQHAALGTVFLGGPLGNDRGTPGATDADLGAIVVAQPEFASCVAQLAWQYAFGSSVALQPTLKQSLADHYRSSQRLNPLIKDVLQHPYFWSQMEAPALHYEDVAPILKNCGSCHTSSRGTQFNPNNYPFRPDPEANAALLQTIWRAINQLPGVRPMPEAPQPRLPNESIEMLRNWISRGAEQKAGQPSLSDEQVEAILQ